MIHVIDVNMQDGWVALSSFQRTAVTAPLPRHICRVVAAQAQDTDASETALLVAAIVVLVCPSRSLGYVRSYSRLSTGSWINRQKMVEYLEIRNPLYLLAVVPSSIINQVNLTRENMELEELAMSANQFCVRTRVIVIDLEQPSLTRPCFVLNSARARHEQASQAACS
jgi:hypothetical protein